MITGVGLSAQDAVNTEKKIIRVPGVGRISFPGSMTDAEIESAILKNLLDGQITRRKTEEDLDFLELFSECRPMHLIVESLPPDALEIGLTVNSIQAAAESRLRSARLYDSSRAASNYLYINVNVVGRAFSTGLKYNKKNL